MVKFTVYPDDAEDTLTASFEDLGTTKELWDNCTEAEKQRLILRFMENVRPINWRLDTYNDND